MALDYMAIVSMGVYPTPVPTTTLRAALAVSYGLLNLALPAGAVSAGNNLVKLSKVVLESVFLKAVELIDALDF